MPSDGSKFATYAMAIRPGRRFGPVRLGLANGDAVQVSMCCLPAKVPRISCAVRLPPARTATASGTDARTGLPDLNAFLAAAEKSLGTQYGMKLVDIPNLSQICAGLPPARARKFLLQIGAALKALGSAGQLTENAFGVVCDAQDTDCTLASAIEGVAKTCDVDGLSASDGFLSLDDNGLTLEQASLAMRQAIGRFTRGDMPGRHQGSLATVFGRFVGEAIARASSEASTAENDGFELRYEAVADLKTGKTGRYDVLTRLDAAESTAESLRIAREIGLADTFDVVSLAQVLGVLESQSTAHFKLALGICGHTLADPACFALFSGLLKARQHLAPRLLLEVATLPSACDFDKLQMAVGLLRQMGIRVGLNHFAPGVLPIAYLQDLEVDFVKIDGTIVRSSKSGDRHDILLRGLLGICTKLGIETVADNISTREEMVRARDIGIKLGQGSYFGTAVKSVVTGLAA
ncbi:MAG: EAL domain-containing protein [Rhizomicrobium sp.]